MVLLSFDTATPQVTVALHDGTASVGGDDATVEDNLIGMHADGTMSTAANAGYGIAHAGDDVVIRHNYVRVDNSGIRREGTAAGGLIEENEIGAPDGGQTLTFDGVLFILGEDDSSSNDLVRWNLIRDQRGGCVEIGWNGGLFDDLRFVENTSTRCGFLADGVTPSLEPVSIVVRNTAPGSTISFSGNLVTANARAGLANLDLVKYLLSELAKSKGQRVEALQQL